MTIIVFRTIADEVITSWSVSWYLSLFWTSTYEIKVNMSF